MRILILSDQKKATRNFHDFFPLYKWRSKLLKEGIEIIFHYNHKEIEEKFADIYIISSRYKFNERNDFKLLFYKIKTKSNKIVLFDASDTTGIVDFDLIDHVDAIIKKQVLKDLSLYTVNNYDLSVRPWLQNMPPNPAYLNYIPCPQEALHKIKVGWNIGLCDYRYFPSYTGLLRNYLITDLPNIDQTIGTDKKDLFTAYRGAINYGNKEISFQRNTVLKVLTELKRPLVLLGGRVDKKSYLKELQKSKVGISPFGWGEICYRDFEIIYSGALLIKPSMDHLNTFPEMYVPGETYVKVKWDMSDLEEQLNDVYNNFSGYHDIIGHAYKKFMNHQIQYEPFAFFFKSLMQSI